MRPLPMRRRVVITGLGTVNPCGLNVTDTWQAMINARSGIGPLTRFPSEGWRTRIAGEVRGFDATEKLGRRACRRLGRFMQFALFAGDEALIDAGFDLSAVLADGDGPWPDPDRFSVYIGSGIGGFPEIVEGAVRIHEQGPSSVSPFFIPSSLINLAGGNGAIRYRARGPSLVVCTACAVGNHAIGEAWKLVRDGEVDVALAGGAEASLSPLALAGFMNMRALSQRNDAPDLASRPFDVQRDGFVMSEGSGLVVLESLEHAVGRGARIYCELVGYGATTDAHHITAPSPGGEGAVRCMEKALYQGGLVPADVDYINAHGTSTPTNDATETQAIRTVFGVHADKLLVSSTKGVTGHLLGAAGGLEAVAVAKALHTGIVPPTANLTHPDPACNLDYVPNVARAAHPRVAISNGFGFGGTNAVLAFKRYEE